MIIYLCFLDFSLGGDFFITPGTTAILLETSDASHQSQHHPGPCPGLLEPDGP
jgi:hypothetical protein